MEQPTNTLLGFLGMLASLLIADFLQGRHKELDRAEIVQDRYSVERDRILERQTKLIETLDGRLKDVEAEAVKCQKTVAELRGQLDAIREENAGLKAQLNQIDQKINGGTK